MQASSTSRVHQTHSATRVTTGVEERETRQRVRKRARTRVRKHSHTPTPLAHGGKHTGGRLTATSHRGCAAQEPAAPLSMQGRHEHRQKPAAARGRGRARAQEPGELTRGASAEIVRARKTFVATLVLERREPHRRKALRGQNDVARRKRTLSDYAQPAHRSPCRCFSGELPRRPPQTRKRESGDVPTVMATIAAEAGLLDWSEGVCVWVPTLEQLCNRYCSNKHTHCGRRRRLSLALH